MHPKYLQARHHCTLKSFTYWEKNVIKSLCNVWMFGIILWCHNNLKIYSPITAFIHLWRHSLTSATLFLAYIKFYHAISHVVIANQKREIFEAFNLINLLVDLCRIQTKVTCRFSCNQVTSFQCEAKQIIYMIGFPSTTLTCNHLKNHVDG